MRAHAAQGWDAGHRDHLPQWMQKAHAVLDRAAEGQRVPANAIAKALVLTGDVKGTGFSVDELRVAATVGARS